MCSFWNVQLLTPRLRTEALPLPLGVLCENRAEEEKDRCLVGSDQVPKQEMKIMALLCLQLQVFGGTLTLNAEVPCNCHGLQKSGEQPSFFQSFFFLSHQTRPCGSDSHKLVTPCVKSRTLRELKLPFPLSVSSLSPINSIRREGESFPSFHRIHIEPY